MIKSPWRETWDALAEYANKSRRSIIKLRPELLEAGVIYYDLKGFPPRKVMYWNRERYNQFILQRNKKSEFL